MAHLANAYLPLNGSALKGDSLIDIVSSLHDEQKEMKIILADILSSITETHPEIVLKYVSFMDRNKK